MPDKKRTERTEKHTRALDNEIKKALEDIIKHLDFTQIKSGENVLANAFDLISRLQAENEQSILNLTSLQNDLTDLQAENERLEDENKILKRDNHFNESGLFNLLHGALVFTKTFDDYNKFINDFKAEAYKEFAERLKEWFRKESEVYKLIDNLLKEMAGDNNDRP